MIKQFKDISGLLPRIGRWKIRPFAHIIDITIHHSGAPVQSAATIAAWHTVGKKYPGIAYHYLVYPDGRVYQCSDDIEITWHNGYCNTDSIGICLVGNFELAPPPEAQWNAAAELCNELAHKYPSIQSVTGHREYKGTTLCPGKYFDMQAFRACTTIAKKHPRAKK